MNEGWRAGASYMEWAKLHSGARYNLATSGLAGASLADAGLAAEGIDLNGPAGYGYPPLLEAVAAHQHVRPDRLVLAAGTSLANHLALAALLEPGDEVMIETPGYRLIDAVAEYLRARIVPLPRSAANGFAIDVDDVRRRLSPRTRAVVVTNLHNPTSVATDEETLRGLGAVAREAGLRVVVDEVYLDAAFEERPSSAALLGPEFVVTSSLTKVYGLSGLRCGWIVAEAELARAIWRLNDLFGVNAPFPSDHLSVLALGRLDAFRARARGILEANRAALGTFLEGRSDLEVVRTAWGTTCFPRLREGRVDALWALLREKYETSVAPGRFFGAPDHFRIGLGGDPETTREGLARLAEALDALPEVTSRSR